MRDNQGIRPATRRNSERLCLQVAVALACLVPVLAGGAGMIVGPAMLGNEIGLVPANPDSHFRYLSGLLCAIGLGFATTVPRIESSGTLFRRLAALVVVGGIGRLISLFIAGMPAEPMLAALAMELLVTPALAVWQHRVARLARTAESQATPIVPKIPTESLPREIGLRSSKPIRLDVRAPRQAGRRVLH